MNVIIKSLSKKAKIELQPLNDSPVNKSRFPDNKLLGEYRCKIGSTKRIYLYLAVGLSLFLLVALVSGLFDKLALHSFEMDIICAVLVKIIIITIVVSFALFVFSRRMFFYQYGFTTHNFLYKAEYLYTEIEDINARDFQAYKRTKDKIICINFKSRWLC